MEEDTPTSASKESVPEPVPKPSAPASETIRREQLVSASIASGEKAKARDIIAAIKTLQLIEREKRLATPDEKQILARFGGFGAVALSIFPDPVKGHYKDAGWESIGKELATLLSAEE